MSFFTTSKGSQIYYERTGKAGAQPLVLIHGLTCDHTHWTNQIEFFSDRFDIVALDQGGHGQSHRDIDNCTIATYADDVVELIDALSLNNPILVGHSMGCRVALGAGNQLGEQLTALVLIDSGLIANKENLSEVRDKLDLAVESYGFAAFTELMFSKMFFDNADPAVKQQIVNQAKAFDPAIGRKLSKDLMAWDANVFADTAKKISCPILGVCATVTLPGFERRPLTVDETGEWSAAMKEIAPHTEIVNIPETGHFVMQERPEQLHKLMDDFIGRL